MPENRPCIAVDAMGGDFGPKVVVPGAVEAAREENFALCLVGDESLIAAELEACEPGDVPVRLVHADEVAGMREKPSDVLRRKKNSSIQVACEQVKRGLAHGVVSAGNSGATVACGMFIVGRIKGVERPALASVMPTEKNPMVLIDVGANVDSRPSHLLQFALMADIFAEDVLGVQSPRVGLMSIGEEEGKGNLLVKEAFDLLRKSSMNFVGNVEGRDVFTGDVDVVVCDGFVGNVALKLSEGLASSMGRLLKREMTRGLAGKLGTGLAKAGLRRFARIVDYAEYGGAPLLGLQNIVIVCHGSSSKKALGNAVKMAARFSLSKANEHLIQKIAANAEFTRHRKAQAVDNKQ